MFVLTDWWLGVGDGNPLEILRVIEIPLTLLCLKAVLIPLCQDGLSGRAIAALASVVPPPPWQSVIVKVSSIAHPKARAAQCRVSTGSSCWRHQNSIFLNPYAPKIFAIGVFHVPAADIVCESQPATFSEVNLAP